MDRLRKVPQGVWLAAGLFFVFNLFYLGAKPIAVGLFPEPWDKLAHFSAFAVLTGLLHFATRGRWPIAVAIVAAAIGGLDEIHQIWLPGRVADINDFAADCCGIACLSITLQLRAWAGHRRSAVARR